MEVVVVFLLFIQIIPLKCRLNGEGNVCGRPIGSLFKLEDDRIIAGYDVGYYRYPWFAALMSSDVVACGGALIGSKLVITAAHCFKDYIITQDNRTSSRPLEEVYSIMLGMYNKCEKEPTQKTFSTKTVHIHEKYKDNLPYYDIAVLVLNEETSSFQPICLPKTFIKTRPKEATVPGFGTLRYHGGTPCTLHEARLLIYSDDDCRKMINRTGNDPKKIYGAFCAGYMQGGIDTCQGDSGGPLQVMDEYGSFVLLGIVSFGFHCANPGLLGMYTDVSQYVEWIEEKTGVKASMSSTNSTQTTTSTTQTSVAVFSKKPSFRPHRTYFLPPPFFRPINIIIFKKNRLVLSKKNVLHYYAIKRPGY